VGDLKSPFPFLVWLLGILVKDWRIIVEKFEKFGGPLGGLQHFADSQAV
jgi:hypothetical protein